MLLVEQNVNEALRLASSAYVMQEGRIVFHAPSAHKQDIIHHLWGFASLASQPAPAAAEPDRSTGATRLHSSPN